MSDALWLQWYCKIIHTIIVNCLLPMSSSRNFMNHQYAWLIFHFVKEIKVNFVHILIESFFEARSTSKPPHRMIIYHLIFCLRVIGPHFNINTLVRPKKPWMEARWKSSNFEFKANKYWYWDDFQITGDLVEVDGKIVEFDCYSPYSHENLPLVRAIQNLRGEQASQEA